MSQEAEAKKAYPTRQAGPVVQPSKLTWEQIQAMQAAPASKSASEAYWGFPLPLVILGCVISALLPIVGWVGGVVYATDPARRRTGWLAIGVATVFFLAYVLAWALGH
jgi:hypothetical protein